MDNPSKRFEELFNNVDVGLYRSRLDGTLLEVNPMLVRISGLDSREEVLKHNIIEIYPNPEDRKFVVEKIKKNGFIKLYSFPAKNFKGKNLLTNISVTLVRGDDGEIYLDGAVQDITELGESKNKLLEVEMKYRDIVENMGTAVFISTLGPVGKFIEVNDAAVKLLGAESKEDLLSRRPSDLYADPGGRKRLSDEVMKNGFAKNLEINLVNYKGKKMTVLSSVVFKNDERGQFFYGTFIDITERKEIEDRLRASEAILKKSQEVAKVGSWILDPKAGKVSWSNEMFKIFGMENSEEPVDLEEVISKAVHPDDRQKVRDSAREAVGSNSPEMLEYRVVWPDKSVHYVMTLPAENITDSDGKVIKLTGIVQDITDRKKIEIDLLVKVRELEWINNLMVDRELKMIELKKEIEDLKKIIGDK